MKSKTVHKMKKAINRGKRSKSLSEESQPKIYESAEFSRDKSRAKGSPFFK